MTEQQRNPAGSPASTGGQFSPHDRQDSDIALGPELQCGTSVRFVAPAGAVSGEQGDEVNLDSYRGDEVVVVGKVDYASPGMYQVRAKDGVHFDVFSDELSALRDPARASETIPYSADPAGYPVAFTVRGAEYRTLVDVYERLQCIAAEFVQLGQSDERAAERALIFAELDAATGSATATMRLLANAKTLVDWGAPVLALEEECVLLTGEDSIAP